jgi:hypothetical protein
MCDRLYELPVFNSDFSANPMSKLIDKTAQTSNILSIKSSRAPINSLQKGVRLGGSLLLDPKCSSLSLKSSVVNPLSRLQPSLSAISVIPIIPYLL